MTSQKSFNRPVCFAMIGVLSFLTGGSSSAAADDDAVGLFAKLLPAIVHVEWRMPSTDAQLQATPEVTHGSGAVVSNDGLVVACYNDNHRQANCQVTFTDGRRKDAKVVVTDRRSRLCLLKVEAAGLDHLKIAEKPPQLGQRVATAYCDPPPNRAVGHGIVTRLKTLVEWTPAELIQTDVRSGISAAGAPLVDSTGGLVGVLVARRDTVEIPVSFAVPAKFVASMLEIHREGVFSEIHAGFLGVQFGSDEEEPSTRIGGVHPDTPAAKAGLREGDVLLRIDDQQVNSVGEVLSAISSRPAGAKVKLDFARNGEEKSAQATLDRRLITAAAQTPGEKPRIQRIRPGEFRVVIPERVRSANVNEQIAVELQKQLSQQENEQAAKLHALDFLKQAQRAKLAEPVLRVQRAQTDQKLDELTKQINDLRRMLESLTQQVQELKKGLQKK